MPFIITELAVQANGTFAIEITCNGSSVESTFGVSVAVTTQTGFQFNESLSNLGAPSWMSCGDSFTVGHSSISGLDGTDNTLFARADAVLVRTFNGAAVYDSIGRLGGSLFARDAVLESDISRTPNTDINDANVSDGFTQTAGFSNNTLGTVQCFLAGTGIATPLGEVPVEALQIGDLVTNSDGRATEVLWLGRQRLKRRIGVMSEKIAPVCIRKDALERAATITAAAASGDFRCARLGRRRGEVGVSGCLTVVNVSGSKAAQHTIASRL